MGRKRSKKKKNRPESPRAAGGTNNDASGSASVAEGMGEAISDVAAQFPSISPLLKVSFQNQYLSDLVLDSILARGIIDTPRNLNLDSRAKLRDYFLSLLVNETTLALATHMIWALTDGTHHVNSHVSTLPGSQNPDQIFPIISLACQWKLLKHNFHWLAEDEMVDMLIKAGADVNNQTMTNQTNALFFAVKYGTLLTVDLLLKAGCNIQQLDNYGRTCLYNATERPSPPILRRLLETLPATETFDVHWQDGRVAFQENMLDRLLQHLVPGNRLISWECLGPPTTADMCESLILIRQKGVSFSVAASAMALDDLGMVCRTKFPLRLELIEPQLYREVAKCLVGVWLPRSCRPDAITAGPSSPADRVALVKKADDEGEETQLDTKPTWNDCRFCMKVAKKSTTLYCGHTFCRKCIINHGQKENGNNCPVCGRLLCNELRPSMGSDDLKSKDALARVMGVNALCRRRGPQYFTDNQLKAEAEYQGINSPDMEEIRSLLIADLVSGRPRRPGPSSSFADRLGSTGMITLSVDLAAAQCVQGNLVMRAPPSKGPVYIEVAVRGIPLLARVSNWSIYTVLSPSVIEQLGLQRIETLRSPKFVDICTGRKVRDVTLTCIEPFSVNVGGIDVVLNNAVEVSPEPFTTNMFGLQLGQDFLMSATWAPIDVLLAEDRGGSYRGGMMRIDLDTAWGPKRQSMCKPDELLRFYSADGRVAHVPLLHFQPFEKWELFGISLKETVKFDVCSWCRRVFPEGSMYECEVCLAAGSCFKYCGATCQRAAWVVHQLRPEHQQKEGAGWQENKDVCDHEEKMDHQVGKLVDWVTRAAPDS